MSDLFHEDVDWQWLDKIFAAMVLSPQHIFLVLTKRPQRMREYLTADRGGLRNTADRVDEACGDEFHFYMDDYPGDYFTEIWPPRNAWFGVTVENQDAMWRIDEMFKIPAAKYWISFEPLLSAIDTEQLKHYLNGCPKPVGGGVHYVTHEMAMDAQCPQMEGMETVEEPDWVQTTPPIDGVVVGGESGPKARPPHPDWFRDIRDACVETGVPFTLKQLGEWTARAEQILELSSKEPAGKRFAKLEYPDSKPIWMARVGKKAAGRELDGKVWNQFPWDLLGAR